MNKTTEMLNNSLLKDISFKTIQSEPETIFFEGEHICKIIEKAENNGLKILGIECWTSNRMEYFTVISRDIYIASQKVSEKNWAVSAVKEIMDEYNQKVLSKFPNDSPLFSIELSK